MLAVALGGWDIVSPPERWMRFIDPPMLHTYMQYWREQAGISQKEAAEAVGVTDKALSAWEVGRVGFPDYALETLRTLYGIDRARVAEIAYEDRLRSRRPREKHEEPLPGRSIAVPDNDIMRAHLTLLDSLEWEEIALATQRLAAILENTGAPARNAVAHDEETG